MDETSTDLSGPYLNAALLCDSILEEKDNRLSLIRILTELTVNLVAPDAPADMPTVDLPLNGIFTFNAGGRPGDYAANVMLIDPRGNRRLGVESTLTFKHDHHTLNLIVRGGFKATMPGLYWVQVTLAGRELTRLPLLVRYSPKTTQTQNPSAPEASPESRTNH